MAWPALLFSTLWVFFSTTLVIFQSYLILKSHLIISPDYLVVTECGEARIQIRALLEASSCHLQIIRLRYQRLRGAAGLRQNRGREDVEQRPGGCHCQGRRQRNRLEERGEGSCPYRAVMLKATKQQGAV